MSPHDLARPFGWVALLVHDQKSTTVSDACIEYNPVKCFLCLVLLGKNDGQTGL